MNLFVVPPLANFLVIALGLALWRKRRRLARALVGLGAGTLVLFSIPVTGALLLIGLQRHPALPPEGALPAADAIVVLGADQEVWAPEYGHPVPGALSLERTRYAAHLQRRSGLPLYVSAGVLRPGLPPLGEGMAAVLEQEFGVPVAGVEADSTNTLQNARATARLLEPLGHRRVLLVTHAWHMPRARRTFERAGLEVVPAPMGFRVRPRPNPGDFVPSSKGLRQSALALHEWIGGLWYLLRT